MDEFFKVLEESKESRGIGILNSFSFQKSHIENIFEQSAPERGFTIDKKGKEIKERLRGMLGDEMQEVSRWQAKIETIPTQVGIAPTEDSSKEFYYLLDGWEESVGTIPACYSWKQCDDGPVNGTVSNTGVFSQTVSEEPTENDTKKLLRDYNEALRRYIECKKEIAMLQTMLTNFDDGKSYKLTVREATILGF